MIEVTVIEPSEHDEIMVNIDSSTKKVIQVYCYSKYVPSIYNESKDTEREVRTYEMKNSLFKRIHIGDFKTYCKQENLVLGLDEPEEEHYSEERNDLLKEVFEEQFPTIELL